MKIMCHWEVLDPIQDQHHRLELVIVLIAIPNLKLNFSTAKIQNWIQLKPLDKKKFNNTSKTKLSPKNIQRKDYRQSFRPMLKNHFRLNFTILKKSKSHHLWDEFTVRRDFKRKKFWKVKIPETSKLYLKTFKVTKRMKTGNILQEEARETLKDKL